MTRPILLPPNQTPPGWFMPKWLSMNSWAWDDERWRFTLDLQRHRVTLVCRSQYDWTWRVKRLAGLGAVSVGGFGCECATDARRDVLATYWSDLWTSDNQWERWRQGIAQRWPAERIKAMAAERARWAEAIEERA